MAEPTKIAEAIMRRQVLSIQTVYFDGNDNSDDLTACRQLGTELYEKLTRLIDSPLAYGVGIPVLSAVLSTSVDVNVADTVVLVPVLGSTTFAFQQEAVVAKIAEWHKTLGAGHVLVIPLDPVWRNVETRLPGKLILTELYGGGDRRRKTLDEIVLAVARLFETDDSRIRLFVSHSKFDLDETDEAAKQIFDHVVTDGTGRAFFDATNLYPGEPLSDQLDEAVKQGVLIAVRGDTYGSRDWCQREVITAKRHGLPTLTVEVLRKGEQRISTYGGNGPSVVWKQDQAAIASRAMVEWLRAAYFRKEAERIATMAGLPNDIVKLTRPPELLDLSLGALTPAQTQLVLHPDPELSVMERQILKGARPRLQLVTPTTAFRQLLSRDGTASAMALPLQGLQVAMSLSDSPDVDGPEGYTLQHINDATVYMARSLISAGVSVAYGGDFRRNGFTPLLAELIRTYNQTAAKQASFLHSYLGAPIKLEQMPKNLPLIAHHLVHSTDVSKDAIIKDQKPHPDALYYSDMRQVMAKHTFARIILGGAAEPRAMPRGPGYGGRYPGIVEEAWRTLQAQKPLYVVGGFGGAAALVADLLERPQVPNLLQDKHWKSAEFKSLAAKIDSDPWRKKLGLPLKMEDLARELRKLSTPLLKNDKASLAWNGLTIDENRFLFRTRDPLAIACLVLQGLLKVSHLRAEGKLEIELVHGSVTAAGNLDAVAVAVFDQIPIGGAGAALDRAIGGRASQGRAQGHTLISLDSADIDANWIYLASLGALDDVDGMVERVERAARETADESQRHGFRRLGVVTFGGAVLTDTPVMARAMLCGFKGLSGSTSVVWFESNGERYGQLFETLKRETKVQLTTRTVAATTVPPPARPEQLIIQVSLQENELSVTTLPPAGSAIASTQSVNLTAAKIKSLSEGGGYDKRDTPDLEEISRRGIKLAEILLGKDAKQLLERCQNARMMIIHDVQSSRLPFELLSTSGAAIRPAVNKGLSRRLAVSGVPTEHLFAKPPKTGRLEVLLIVNPTGDLPGTLEEAKAVRNILKPQANVRLIELVEKAATKAAVVKGLGSADVVHYCGHAFYDGPGPHQSGLILAGSKLLTLEDLVGCATLPRVAFVNACEAGRVRGRPTEQAAAFAEIFLRSGIEAYLGTYWRVGDSAAATFAAEVYLRLAEGQMLDSAVTKARSKLFDANERDWANYMLYGDGSFQLIVN